MPPDVLPWRSGAYLDDKDKPPACELVPDVDDIAFDDTPRPLRRLPAACLKGVNSIARLTAEKSASGDLDRFKKSILGLRETNTQTLIVKIATAMDPLTLWAIHVRLDALDVPPCLRWPKNDSTSQMEFIGWLADVLWFTKRNREHRPKFQGWQRLLLEEPNTPAWRERAYWIFVATYGRQNLSSYGARGLALDHEQRELLMMFPTSRMVAARLELQPIRFAEIRQRLLSHAEEHPDKSGTHNPDSVANRKSGLYRVAVLSGHSPTATAENWRLLTGEATTRQVISRRLKTIKANLKDWA